MRHATTQIPQADLSNPIWTIEHLCSYFHLRKAAATARTRLPGFPAPIAGAQRYRRWKAEEVLAWDGTGMVTTVEDDDDIVFRAPRKAS